MPGVNEFRRRVRARFEPANHILDFFLRAVVRRVGHFASQIKNARAHGTRAFDLALSILYEVPGLPSTANPRAAEGRSIDFLASQHRNTVEWAPPAGAVIHLAAKNSGA